MQSIILVRLSALGDVLMCVPLVRTLQAHFPKAQITWVISRPAYDLVEGMGGVEFIVLDKPNGLGDYYRFYKQLKHRKFDVLLAAQASFRANLLYPLIRAKRKIGYDKLRAKDGHGWFIHESILPGKDHTLESFLKFSKPLGVDTPVIRWDLFISESDKAWAREVLPVNKRLLVINPAASKPERSWVLKRYISVAKLARKRWGAEVILTGGPGAFDRTLADEILHEVPDCIDLVGKTKPKQLLAVIEQADCVLCPDTGPSHMGASVGTPVVALHAVTSAQVSGPYPYLELVVDYYPQAMETILHQTPETHVWGTHAHGKDTMALVPLDAVVKRLDEVFHTCARVS